MAGTGRIFLYYISSSFGTVGYSCDVGSGCAVCTASNVSTGFEKKKVQVGKDQEKAQSEKDSHSKV